MKAQPSCGDCARLEDMHDLADAHESAPCAAVGAGEEVVPASNCRALQLRVRELQRLLGKRTLEHEILRDAGRSDRFRIGGRCEQRVTASG
jgi:hypothetical protein